MFRFKPLEHNIWLDRYNDVISKAESFNGPGNFRINESGDDDKMTLHHIIPRSLRPELKNDKRNWIYLNFYDHAMMHYYLWRYDAQYAPQLWFIAVYGRKHGLWDFPEGEEEYERLKKDAFHHRDGRKILHRKRK